ncbi:MAG: hypothetical protein R3272_05315 [Candidatus Promineifilaceae bacterium]|nr:hypothetical protein [Candidatus Promineifilaceae bacterium]
MSNKFYHNALGNFVISLPATWQVEEQGPTDLGAYYRIGLPPLGPGPESSALFIADAEALTVAEAAVKLGCGEACAADDAFEEIELGGQPAQRVLIGEGENALEWLFIPYGDRLIFLTLHDPESLETRQDLLQTLHFSELTPTPTSTPTATPTPAYDFAEISARDTITVPEVITFTIPAGWAPITDTLWSPPAWPSLRLGFEWVERRPDAALDDLLPDGEVRASEPLSVTWGSGISATLTTDDGWEQHLLVEAGVRDYHFYTEGPTERALRHLRPVLLDTVENAQLLEVVPYIDAPVEAALAWVRALLRDPTGAEARPYMTEQFRSTVPEGTTPLAAMQLESRIVIYYLRWVTGSDRLTVLEAELDLLNDTTVTRQITLLFEPVVGWRVHGVSTE